MQDTRHIIIEAIADEVGCEPIEITPLKTLGDIGADSLDVCEIGLNLEEVFGLKTALEFHTHTTVQKIFDSVEIQLDYKH